MTEHEKAIHQALKECEKQLKAQGIVPEGTIEFYSGCPFYIHPEDVLCACEKCSRETVEERLT